MTKPTDKELKRLREKRRHSGFPEVAAIILSDLLELLEDECLLSL
jgi:hypothetical protein